MPNLPSANTSFTQVQSRQHLILENKTSFFFFLYFAFFPVVPTLPLLGLRRAVHLDRIDLFSLDGLFSHCRPRDDTLAKRQENFGLLFQTVRSSCVMFVAAVCILFLVKLKWPKSKSVWEFLLLNF